ncbi:MAG: response regulator [Candidatus Lokiarchaeota archaeon]|nr:response regulator [Candidatus Lokiarchaeota archaeon]
MSEFKTILHIDDNEELLRNVKNFFKDKYKVIGATSIEEAKKLILTEDFDYAFIDLQLDHSSEYGGISLINFTKRNKPNAKTIIVSAYFYDQVKEDLKQVLLDQCKKDEIYNEKDVMDTLNEIEKDYICKGDPNQNFFKAIFKKMQKLDNKKKQCFVIMPFSETKSCSEDDWSFIFRNLIKKFIEESNLNYECNRADLPQGEIIRHILDNLNRADIVVADLTDKNSNVLYELGVRHSLKLGNRTILIAQNVQDIPSDLRGLKFIIYDWKEESRRKKFQSELLDAIKAVTINPVECFSPVRKYLDL